MNRIDRLLGILTRLQATRYASCAQISEQYGVSERTVFRDLASLQEMGVPIGHEPSKGYFVVDGYFLPPVALTTDEANALLLMEPFSKAFGDKSIHTHYSSALKKIRAILKLAQKETVDDMANSMSVRAPYFVKTDTEYLTKIQNAILRKQIIQIDYQNVKGENTTRKIEPIGLVFYALYWHMVAWCHVRKSYRDFRVDRVQCLAETNEPFTISPHITLSEYLPELPTDH